ncbi:MAG TPA: twin-arginine translocase TatA/TatE family subunit [Pirellulales bacterium]|jgi:sec-independent protein translocase protein TatA|nr:twin-arginine translocase TatA/TatE family subunit [Pirellulales bacterium]
MFEGLSPSHLVIVLGIALLLFGDRLPQVMRSVGKGVLEFKKGLRGIESAIEAAATAPAATSNQSSSVPSETIVHRDEVSVPRFSPPTSEPRAETLTAASAPAATAPASESGAAPPPVVEYGHSEQHGGSA